MSEHTDENINDPSADQQDPESGPAAQETPGGEGVEDQGPDVADLDDDPAYNPDGPLKDTKGG